MHGIACSIDKMDGRYCFVLPGSNKRDEQLSKLVKSEPTHYKSVYNKGYIVPGAERSRSTNDYVADLYYTTIPDYPIIVLPQLIIQSPANIANVEQWYTTLSAKYNALSTWNITTTSEDNSHKVTVELNCKTSLDVLTIATEITDKEDVQLVEVDAFTWDGHGGGYHPAD